MAMYGAKPIPTRTPLERHEPPAVEVGDRVRLRNLLTTDRPVLALEGATGTVSQVSGGRVLVELDEPYVASGVRRRQFWSFADELERARVVGRMGAVELFDDGGEGEGEE
jgi:hypothetical protein